MSWVWIVAAVWVALSFGIAVGWALRGSIGLAPRRFDGSEPTDLEPMQWMWPTVANSTASFTMTTTGGSDDAGAAGVRVPGRPKPKPPHLQLVREYAPTLTVTR